MYVSSWRSGDITIRTYPEGKEVGAIAGFRQPEGECVDAAGNVFIVDRLAGRIQEFAHGGTVPVQTLDYSGAHPYACSVDPVTGNLAVTNGAISRNKQGVIAIYAGATGTPQIYSSPDLNAEYCGYDDRGNLYVDGLRSGYHFALKELPKGSAALVPVSLDTAIHYPGSIQWDGKYMMVADSFPPAAYRFAFTASGGTRVGTTKFGSLYQVAQLWIHRDRVTGANGGVSLWKYPAGGNPIKSYDGSYSTAGVVSPAASR